MGAISHRRNVLTIASLAFVVRLTTLVLLVVLPYSGLVPVFDSSARSMGAMEGLVRWDVLHFLSIYRHGGRTVEQQWAFGKGIRWVLFLGRSIIPGKWLTDDQAAVLGGSLLAVLASVSSSVLLFFLTIELTASSQFSMLTSLLHVLSPSPSTQVVPYTEPFFAFFTFAGMLGFARLEVHSLQLSKSTVQLCRLSIAGVWAIATCFRPLGILMAGFWAWNWVRRTLDQIWSQPKRRFTALPAIGVSAIETAFLVLATCSPFLIDQYEGYQKFCVRLDSSKPQFQTTRPWCSYMLPAIYPFVQSFYWDVGFLRYWTLGQLPNFIISSPLYFVSFLGVVTYYCSPKQLNARPFLQPRLAIHVHLQLLLTILLFTNSHSQIILRQAASIPAIWWALADRVGTACGLWSGQKRGRWWLIWCGLWAPISILLWAGFYPPA